ncbi:MAG: hypothetical protein ACYS6I_01705 [Planctomycetota bacterium]|jgi:hypothetical protein
MSARVEILVEQLNNVVIVPVQVVANRGGKKVCYVLASKPKEREVKTGSFNDTFVQILDGLESGEKVLLSPPKITRSEDQTGSEPETEPSSQDQGESEPQSEERQGRERSGESELTDERIERTMGFLEQMDPEKAQELKQLKTSDPEKFKAELKKLMSEQSERGGHGGRGDRGRQRRDGDTTSP